MLHAAVAARAVVQHGTNIGPAINAPTAAMLLFANVAIVAPRGRHVGTGGNALDRELVAAILAGILMRHRTNIRAGEHLLLSALAVTRVCITAVRILVRHRTNVWASEHLLLSALAITRISIAAVRIFMRHRTNVWASEYLLLTSGIAARILVRHRPDIWTGKNLFLAGLTVSTSRIFMRHRANVGAMESSLFEALTSSSTDLIIVAIPAAAPITTGVHRSWPTVSDQDRLPVRRDHGGWMWRNKHRRRIAEDGDGGPRNEAGSRTPAPAASADEDP
jgi:hypothetical protein